MENIEEIIRQEQKNARAIYLYQNGDKWCAYERSAFNFTSLFRADKIAMCVVGEKADVVVCAEIGPELMFLDGKACCSMDIVRVEDRKIEIWCKSSYVGFKPWKQAYLNTI